MARIRDWNDPAFVGWTDRSIEAEPDASGDVDGEHLYAEWLRSGNSLTRRNARPHAHYRRI